jgi:hypothetical protein
MIVFILSAIDLLAGGLLLLNLNILITYIAAIIFFKGFFSVISSLGLGYMWDWMGWIDMITAASLALFSFGFPASAFTYVAYIVIFKGTYTMVRGLFNF